MYFLIISPTMYSPVRNLPREIFNQKMEIDAFLLHIKVVKKDLNTETSLQYLNNWTSHQNALLLLY